MHMSFTSWFFKNCHLYTTSFYEQWLKQLWSSETDRHCKLALHGHRERPEENNINGITCGLTTQETNKMDILSSAKRNTIYIICILALHITSNKKLGSKTLTILERVIGTAGQNESYFPEIWF